jgi:tRNA A-37 threonylcarbamoyl transferase component Bud32/tetratricopeptide (TPR) repeat protein
MVMSRGPSTPRPEYWERAKEIFGRALERPIEERRAFVTAECRTDDALCREVLSLLTEHTRVGSFLSEPLSNLLGEGTRDSLPQPNVLGEATHDLAGGSVLGGRYTIQRVIGRGGMATVYLATDLQNKRPVAVKVLHPERAASLDRERFLQEIGITAHFVHPHILPLHDWGEDNGLLFYTMPYVEGETIRARLTRAGRLPIDEAVRITREVADALTYAHTHGIIHRDIKPENILLADGHAVVSDFGIGHAVGRTLTGSGIAIGTPLYMSPEQARGDAKPDGRSDIYSLGCVLHEMLTGRPPFCGDTPREVLAQHQFATPPSVRVSRNDVPPAIDAALRIALAKEPTQRFETARQFADALSGGHAAKRWKAALWPSLALIAALIVALMAYAWRPQPAIASPLVTVAPFHVASADPALQHWREEISTLVASGLDAAQPLRSSSAVSMGRRPDVTDRSAAVALGRLTGAHYVVFGRVLRDRQRAVRVEAEVVDVGHETIIDQVHAVSGAAEPVDDLLPEITDSLTLALLTSFGASIPLAATRHAPFGCAGSSHEAMMSYIRGEQFYRRTQWDSAVTAYEQAIAQDSGCALAYHRIATALGWQGTESDSAVRAYRFKAGEHNHGLSPRDSLLITADSLSAAAETEFDDTSFPASSYWAHVRRLLATLDDASRRYPGDPEVWYSLADVRYHRGWGPASTTVPEMMGAFEQAIRLDSGFALSYLHPIELTYGYTEPTTPMQYLDAYLATEPTGLEAEGARLVKALTNPRTAHHRETLRHLASDSLDVLIAARNLIDSWSDSTAAAVRLSRAIAQRSGRDTILIARCRGGRVPSVSLAERLAYRGQLREALCALGDTSRWRSADEVFIELSALGAIPDSIVSRGYDVLVHEHGALRNYALPWLAGHRDTALMDVLLRSADSVLATASATAGQRERASYEAAAVRAYRALARRDTTRALAEFARLDRTQCRGCFDMDRLVEAQLMFARANWDGADKILREWRGPSRRPSDVTIAFDRARIAERQGRRETAIAMYRFVVKTWWNADPLLQPTVAEANRALHRLGAE